MFRVWYMEMRNSQEERVIQIERIWDKSTVEVMLQLPVINNNTQNSHEDLLLWQTLSSVLYRNFLVWSSENLPINLNGRVKEREQHHSKWWSQGLAESLAQRLDHRRSGTQSPLASLVAQRVKNLPAMRETWV